MVCLLNLYTKSGIWFDSLVVVYELFVCLFLFLGGDPPGYDIVK